MTRQKAFYTHKQAEASLNMLARIIANENITITMNANAPTAAFDLQNRVLVLPAWEALSKDMGEATRGHEVAHALWTPAKGWHSEVKKFARDKKIKFPKMYANCLNIAEDARIEKKLKEHLPGFRAVMERAYKEMYEFLLPQQNMTVDQMCAQSCLDRINYVAKAGYQHIGRLASNEEKLAYVKMMEAQTWEDAVAVADILYDMRLREKQNQKDDQSQQGMPQYSDGSDGGIPDEVLDWDEMTDEQKAEAQRRLNQKNKNKPQKDQKQAGKDKDAGENAGQKDKQEKSDKGEKGQGEQADKGEDQNGDAGQEGQGEQSQDRESNGEFGAEGSESSDNQEEGNGSEGSGDEDSDGSSNDNAKDNGKLGGNQKDKKAGQAGAPVQTRGQLEAGMGSDEDDKEMTFSLEKVANDLNKVSAVGKAIMPRIVAKKQVNVRSLFE